VTTPAPTPPPFVELPRFNRDNLPLGGWETFRKKVNTDMIRVAGPFVVETREGPLVCRDGWLARDPNGDPYPIATDVQAAIYEPAIGIPQGET
jgi:hypothetical protein